MDVWQVGEVVGEQALQRNPILLGTQKCHTVLKSIFLVVSMILPCLLQLLADQRPKLGVLYLRRKVWPSAFQVAASVHTWSGEGKKMHTYIHIWNSLRGYCTSYQKLACFVLYLKIIITILKNSICILYKNVQGSQKWHWNFRRPSSFSVI